MRDLDHLTPEDWETLTPEEIAELERRNAASIGSSLSPTGEIVPDGFRSVKRRGENWLDTAIAEGSVRAPNAPDPDEGADYSNAVVVRPPVMTARSE
jgi:hypothetical protein